MRLVSKGPHSRMEENLTGESPSGASSEVGRSMESPQQGRGGFRLNESEVDSLVCS